MKKYNKEILQKVFRDALGLEESYDVSSLTYRSVEEWDSIAHMVLIAELEDVFSVMLETDDVIGLNSFDSAVQIIEKQGVILES